MDLEARLIMIHSIPVHNIWQLTSARVDQKVRGIFKKLIYFTKTTYIHELISQHSCHSGQCTSQVDVSRFEDRL